MLDCQQRIRVTDTSQVGETRRAAMRLASRAGFDESLCGRVAIVASELANNLVRHAVDGAILLQRLALKDGPAIEVISIDKGPGMLNIERCVGDGFSTNGTSGNGLGAVRRLSNLFDVYSRPGSGTVVVSRIGAGSPSASSLEFGVVCQPYPGEEVCGDAWAIAARDDGMSIMLVDGLGHGLHASEASREAVEAFHASPDASPSDIITDAHHRMASTRGGAVAVASYDGRSCLRYGAVGNIAGALVGEGKSRGLCSQNGTVGAQIRQLKELDYDCAPGTLAILHSDGLTTRWNTDLYSGLTSCHPAVISAVLYRDFVRGRDDVTVLVARV